MRRLAALGALGLLATAIGLAVAATIASFPNGLTVLACLAAALLLAWWALLRPGPAGTVAAVASGALVVAAIVLTVVEGNVLADAGVVAAMLASIALARRALAVRPELEPAQAPAQPVLFYNPKSGGGKAERFHLAREARARGITPVELKPGDDLRELVGAAVARGADGLAAAGGDGTQAIVAAAAAEHGLPYACIPAGTRNHFALDLGVDRNDVVGALDAFVDGAERRVDLAEVNGRVFVNNVSLGLYAEAVQQAGYRDAKLRTLAETVPAVIGPKGRRLDLRWSDGDGHEHASADVVLVSNDPYRLGRALGSGTRPRLDTGVLGIAVALAENGGSSRRRVMTWSARDFEIQSADEVPAGLDGEAVRLDSPLRFRSRPGALRVRVARHHPGLSPSATLPDTPWGVIRSLVAIAVRG
ncbi:MAG TPA: diacylglycerol kinase family protein [Thermoleophilaceae bacterium]|nr:diacylglycerol kinase family protein [Thermoleophilaceae bacterium]